MTPPEAPTRFEPSVNADSAPFWESTREKKLVTQWCTDCDRGIFYPRSFCPSCGSRGAGALEWRLLSGRGSVYAAVVEHRPDAAGAVFSAGEPYCVALVDLDEGVRMVTNIVGCSPDDVRIAMKVVVIWEPLSDGRHLPLFEPERTDP